MKGLLAGLAAVAAFAQAAPEPSPELPKVLRISSYSLKPGKAAIEERMAGILARAMGRAKYPANSIGLSSASGEPAVWILEAHDSYASVESADAFVENSPALKWSAGQFETQTGELVSAERRMLAAYRRDLSYHGEQLARDLPKMRYLSVVMVRLHPSRDADFTQAVRLVTAAYEKIASDQPMAVYQVVSGAPGPAYLFFSPMISLKTMDEAPARGLAIREAMGESGAAAMLKATAEVTAASESFLFALNPKMSYVSKEFAAADPDFWTPKPPPKLAEPPAAAPKP